MTIFFDTPWWLCMVVVTGTFVLVSCAGQAIVKRSFPKADFVVHNEVAGFIIAVVGVLYSVLLGFITVIVWEQYTQAEDRVGQEINAVQDAYSYARAFPQPQGRSLRVGIARYVDGVRFDEWPKMQRGERSANLDGNLASLFETAAGYEPRNRREASVQGRLLDQLTNMTDLRRRRLDNDRSGIPGIVWAALIFGAMSVLGFIYLFGYPTPAVQLLMTAFTAVVIGLCFSIVIKLDFPFRGDVSISSQRWSDVRDRIASYR